MFSFEEAWQWIDDTLGGTADQSVMGHSEDEPPPESGVHPTGPGEEPPPESGVYPKPLNPSVEVPGRPKDDPVPSPPPPELEPPPVPEPGPVGPPAEPLPLPDSYPEVPPDVTPDVPTPDPDVDGDVLDDVLEAGGEVLDYIGGPEVLIGEVLPVVGAGIAGYALGDYIAPYVYGDKNLDGSPVSRTIDESEIDPNYEDTWGWKINQWLEE